MSILVKVGDASDASLEPHVMLDGTGAEVERLCRNPENYLGMTLREAGLVASPMRLAYSGSISSGYRYREAEVEWTNEDPAPRLVVLRDGIRTFDLSGLIVQFADYAFVREGEYAQLTAVVLEEALHLGTGEHVSRAAVEGCGLADVLISYSAKLPLWSALAVSRLPEDLGTLRLLRLSARDQRQLSFDISVPSGLPATLDIERWEGRLLLELQIASDGPVGESLRASYSQSHAGSWSLSECTRIIRSTNHCRTEHMQAAAIEIRSSVLEAQITRQQVLDMRQPLASGAEVAAVTVDRHMPIAEYLRWPGTIASVAKAPEQSVTVWPVSESANPVQSAVNSATQPSGKIGLTLLLAFACAVIACTAAIRLVRRKRKGHES